MSLLARAAATNNFEAFFLLLQKAANGLHIDLSSVVVGN
jgi:hypothetical protein